MSDDAPSLPEPFARLRRCLVDSLAQLRRYVEKTSGRGGGGARDGGDGGADGRLGGVLPDGGERGHGHSHAGSHALGAVEIEMGPSGAAAAGGGDRAYTTADVVAVYALEAGIAVHSVIIGLAFGTLGEMDTVKPLLAALVFHQFFEGIGLGFAIRGPLGRRKVLSAWGAHARERKTVCVCVCVVCGRCVALLQLLMLLLLLLALVLMLACGDARARGTARVLAVGFAASTPVGAAIGVGISASFSGDSASALLVQGTLDALCAGILLHAGLVDMIARSLAEAPKGRRLASTGAVVVGAAVMAVIGIWA